MLITNKLKLILLEALLSEVFNTTVRYLAQSVGVSPSMVSTAVPLNLLIGASIPKQ